MKIAICPGSFDPVTLGHLDIISRASGLFDKVIVAVLCNMEKNPSFSVEERMEFLRQVTAQYDNVEVDSFQGLLVDFAKEKGAVAVVKGLRAVSDFEYEFQMSMINKKLYPNVETVYLNTSQDYMYLSSSVVKQIASLGGDISNFVPEAIHDKIVDRLRNI
ncbi:MAG: pantetheine-phosphate adenylyltransferase [Ruminococcaceae bacterium]|nr:pantetheine-phosphate adenylyltransferase [Oscillospiraceae bacterium]